MPRLSRAQTSRPGISRVRRGRGFSYRDEEGRPIPVGVARERINALAVPPAWTDVWIAPSETAHIQAMGVDVAGRIQYIYHPAWRDKMDRAKFERMLELAHHLPSARRVVTRDLVGPSLNRTRVLAGAFRLLDLGSVRPGADHYTDQYGSYGITTLRGSHATVHAGEVVELRFSGKSGRPWHLEMADAGLAALVSELKRRGPRSRLFAWRDDDRWRAISPQDINDYVKDRTRGEFTAKDFRTLAGTATAALALAKHGPVEGEPAQRKAVVEAVRAAADALGNTPAIARASYVDPRLLEQFAKGNTIDARSRKSVESQLIALLGP